MDNISLENDILDLMNWFDFNLTDAHERVWTLSYFNKVKKKCEELTEYYNTRTRIFLTYCFQLTHLLQDTCLPLYAVLDPVM